MEARSLFSDGLYHVSDAGFFEPQPGAKDWDGLLGMEQSVIRERAKETGNWLLGRLADFHACKYPRWDRKRPHKRQGETFQEFLARGGKPVTLRWRTGRFIERAPFAVA